MIWLMDRCEVDTDDLIQAKFAIWAGETDTSALIPLDSSPK
jgi:hypothetical protein